MAKRTKRMIVDGELVDLVRDIINEKQDLDLNQRQATRFIAREFRKKGKGRIII